MLIAGIFSEATLYLCFSILLGSFILYLIPTSLRPKINVSKGILMGVTTGVAFLSFVPVLTLILHLYEDIGFTRTVRSVLFTFEVGQAWIFIYLFSTLLFIFIVWFDYKNNRLYALIGALSSFILILAIGWSSHASSLEPLKGFITHTTHFTAVSVWIGILFVVSWFSKNYSNWLAFLRWYTPVAIVCFIVTIFTGLFLMMFVVEIKEYPSSWMLSYGQALLLKHLLIIPLLLFAVINSWFIRKQLRINSDFNPKPWARVESILILLIFSATAALGQQAPPHDIVTTLKSVGASKLFTTLYQGQYYPEMTIHLGINLTSISLILFALVFLVLLIYSFVKKAPAATSIIMGILFVLSAYLSLMLSIR
ncbi:copper resistance D family protein [Cytobacillus kochii]|uniref:copper resistance D family protein n=1 Tax=Cytobacillus kochii TaxID=859143 RepID=UPI00204091B6|nr:CopD family protein [Cytobacillus kochii]MCM3324753.1 CopD family protein [Cytobacillus kochii]MCM3347146.1 CopD family protein [Cytobacillus kochii]